jgi:hypothetical protein
VQRELQLPRFHDHPGITALDPGAEIVGTPATQGITNDSSDSTSFQDRPLSEEINQRFTAIHLNKLAPFGHLSLATIEIQV